MALARDAITLVEYRLPGQRGSPHRAYVPGDVWDDEVARADLEAATGKVAKVRILGTVHRSQPGVLASREEPAPLAIPFVKHVPVELPVIGDAWVFSRGLAVRAAAE